jgi:hypothetical protein
MARLDYPTEEIELTPGRQVTPVLTAVGWLRTTSDNIAVKVPGQRPVAPPPEDDRLKSLAAYVMGGLSVRVVGPLRLTGDDLRAGVASEVSRGSLFGSVCFGAELTTN